MKIKQEVASTEAAQLMVGDTITTGVTHEIMIRGDKAWVKFECITKVGDAETSETAKQRAIDYVSASVIDAVKAANDRVEEVYAKMEAAK